MKKIISILLAALTLTATACTKQKTNMNDNQPKSHKTLVAYFSATGTTARVAQQLAQTIGADLYTITPKEGYTAADLDWNNPQSRSSVEMKDNASRPELGGKAIDTKAYDVVFIGYPIWWDLAPHAVNTFIETHDLKGKTVVPFATSGGSTITNSVKALRKAYPNIEWNDGRLLNHPSESELKEWAEQF